MTWGVVRLVIPAEAEDDLVGRLAGVGQGMHFERLHHGRGRLSVYVDSPEAGEALVGEVRRALAAAGLDPETCEVDAGPVADGRWVERYQAGLRPFDLGRRFRVLPAGRVDDTGGRIPLVLVPGRAFGTGEHATTRLCAAALERLVSPGERWVDLGCGTGVLAMVAAHCGAAAVLAVDNDPEAVSVATDTVRDNGLGAVVDLLVGSVGEIAVGPWDGVVANIAGSFFLRAGGAVGGLLRPGGRLIATGFLRDDVEQLEGVLYAAGLRRVGVECDGDWAVMELRRVGGD